MRKYILVVAMVILGAASAIAETPEQNLKAMLGGCAFDSAVMASRIQAAEQRIKELEAKLAEKEKPTLKQPE